MTPMIERYRNALEQIPAPGEGNGCHTALLGVANLGVISGVDGEKIFEDIRSHIPRGKRLLSNREIADTIKKALSDFNNGTFTPTPKPPTIINDGQAALRKLINESNINHDADLWENSPIRLYGGLRTDHVLFLKTLFEPDEIIWIGEHDEPGIPGENIRAAAEWIQYFENGGESKPHIIINPLTGLPGPKKSGDGTTYRGDGNVRQFKYCMIEFDNLSRPDQIAFWTVVKLPVVTLIDSGGKSIHAWLDVAELAKVETLDDWTREIKMNFYETMLKPLGVDGACSNPARLSRLPGHFREEKQNYQKLLWLRRPYG